MLSQPFLNDALQKIRLISSDPVIVLRQAYAREQGWLPFMDGVVVFEPALPSQTAPLPHVLNERRWRGKIMPDAEQRNLFVYEKGVEQYALPFVEQKAVSNRELKRLLAADFPAWERTDEGDLLQVIILRSHVDAARAWCLTNCRHRFHISTVSIFQTSYDLIMFKLAHETRGSP